MAEEISSTDMKSILFTQLVMSFQASAMQQMGKIKNPFTDTIERNLSQAQLSIDMLAMLQDRTRGNLTPEEARLIEHVLFELRINYVDEVEKEKKAAEEQKGREAEEKAKDEGKAEAKAGEEEKGAEEESAAAGQRVKETQPGKVKAGRKKPAARAKKKKKESGGETSESTQ